MWDTSNIREHAEVLGSCGNHVGTVDRVEGEWIKLTRSSADVGDQHHYVPLDWVESADEAVHLSRPAEEVFKAWQTEPAAGPRL